MRLVDREERDPRPRKLSKETLVVKALRCDVEKLQSAGAQPLEDLTLLGGVEAGIKPRRIDPASLQEVDLVLHQRDQRRHHNRHPVEEQRRQLVTEALARSSRKHSQRRPPREKRIDDLLLSWAEGIEPEPRREHLEQSLSRHGLMGHRGRLARRRSSPAGRHPMLQPSRRLNDAEPWSS